MKEERLAVGVLIGPANARSAYLRALARTAEKMDILVYSMAPWALLAAGRGPVNGWSLGRNGRFGVQPFPDVVYNRIPTRREEGSAEAAGVKKTMRDWGIPYFNERFFDKRELHEALSGHSDTSRLLPDTRARGGRGAIREMLVRHGSIYVKPVSGSFGEGIHRLSLEKDGCHLQYRMSEEVAVRRFDRIDDAVSTCAAELRGCRFVVQEDAKLARFGGAPTDFRVHAARGHRGWFIAGVGAKVARPGGITTHVHSGGRIADVDEVLRAWFGRRSQTVRDDLENAAVAVCGRLTRALDDRLGELGLDMGIRQDGRIVVFEANAKPGRVIFTHPRLRESGRAARVALLEWAARLAESSRSVGV